MNEQELEDYLLHYGVKGMRWGVIKKDDTTGRTRLATKEERTTNRVSKASGKVADAKRELKEYDALGLKNPRLRKIYGNALDQEDVLFQKIYGRPKASLLEKQRGELVKNQKQAEADLASVKKGGLTRNQKIAIGAGIAGVAVLAAYGAYRFNDIRTARAGAGDEISRRNFMKRYANRAMNWTKKPLTKEEYDKLSTEDLTVPKGTVFSRVSSNSQDDLSKRQYVTFDSEDSDKYVGIYAPVLRGRTKMTDLYVNEMKMKSDVKSPSPRKRVDLLKELIDDPNSLGLPDTKTRAFIKEQWVDSPRDPLEVIKYFGDKPYSKKRQQEIADFDKLSSEEVALKYYSFLARNLVSDDAVSKSYLKKVQDAGYNALVDDNDAGQLSNTPLILLGNAASRVTDLVDSYKSSPLTSEMEEQARKRLVEIRDPMYTK